MLKQVREQRQTVGALAPQKIASLVVEAGSTPLKIKCTAHPAQVGDILRFTSTTNLGIEYYVISVAANTISLNAQLPGVPSAGDTFNVYRLLSNTPSSLIDGSKVVTTAGTRVQLFATSTPCRKIDLCANLANTGVIVVGSSTVIASAGTRRGFPLSAGDFYMFEIDDASKVYIDSTVNGEGVSFNIFT
jgi:hypothetical protein